MKRLRMPELNVDLSKRIWSIEMMQPYMISEESSYYVYGEDKKAILMEKYLAERNS